jgi:hypothetical protein
LLFCREVSQVSLGFPLVSFGLYRRTFPRFPYYVGGNHGGNSLRAAVLGAVNSILVCVRARAGARVPEMSDITRHLSHSHLNRTPSPIVHIHRLFHLPSYASDFVVHDSTWSFELKTQNLSCSCAAPQLKAKNTQIHTISPQIMCFQSFSGQITQIWAENTKIRLIRRFRPAQNASPPNRSAIAPPSAAHARA